MISQILISVLLFSSAAACPEAPEPPCTCRLIGFHSSIITCQAVDNEVALQKSLQSMKSSSIPIRTVEIFESNLNYLPSKAFEGLKIQRLFIAGSSLVSLSDSDAAFTGLEDSLETLLVHECNIFSGWSWSVLRNLNSLTELSTIKAGMESIDEDIKDIAHLNIRTLFLTQDSISYIHDTAFESFRNLEVLSLKRNSIKELKRSMFPNPANLVQIILNYNALQHLPKDIFSDMPSLRSISLSDNSIITVDKLTFMPVWDHLNKIDLTGNPLRCDCRMQWLLGVSLPRNTWIQCEEPTQLREKQLKDLAPKDLWC